jgi:tetratricopeptide (TPR) repeat protein
MRVDTMRGRGGAALAGLILLITPVSSGAQDSASGGAADAYYRFLLGRHLESEGDIDRAIESYRAAIASAEESAEVRAELASLLARVGRVDEAVAEARAALGVDAANREAHRVLGMLLAAAFEGATGRVERQEQVREAITHLEQARPPDGLRTDPSVELTLGRLYIGTGQPRKAAPVLRDLLEDYPTSAEAWILLSEAYTADGRADAAADALREGAGHDPRLWLALAELHERQEQWPQAADAYERAASFGPASRQLRGRWAGALLNVAGDESAHQARTLLEAIVAEDPEDDRALYMLSQAHRRLKAWDAAEAAARRVLALEPASLWGPYALAQVFEDRHEYERVVETLAPALEAWTPSRSAPRAHGLTLMTHLGFAQLQLGRHDDAVATFERARGLAEDPSAFEVYLGQALVVAKRFTQALGILEPLAARRPADYRVTQLRARALAGAGRSAEAVDVLRSAITVQPAPDRYLLLSQLLSDASRREEAHALLDEASARFPADASIPFQRGALYESAGDVLRAEAAFREVLARDPRHAPALNYLGYMLAERGVRLDEALGFIERALAVDPENGAYLDSLGWAYYQLKQFDRAHFHLARAAERMPSNSVVQDHLGDALAALGRGAEAIAAWTRALDGDRESVEVAAIEGKIRRARSQAER